MFRPTAQSETSNEEMDFFSYSIAHDLRSPLLAIDGLSHILERRCGELLGVEGGRILQAIRQTTARMGRLMDDLLAFSRWGRQEKKVAEIDMAALACEVFSDLDPGRPGLQFRVRPLPPIQADPSMIRQVFRNLISNGLKFTAPKQRAFIEVGGEARFSENHYFVKDNGMGFDMHRANELFNPFCRLHSGQEFAGTGVGLAIVKRIILGHGGRVWAEGVLGEGATFHFALPTQSASGKCWKNEEAL
jgi:light-regulated signal transduction histidine kinase (bacteriophytochrome)